VINHLTVPQRAELLRAYRETFTADDHGDALKAMYSRFEAAYGVSRKALQAEVLSIRHELPKEFRKLQSGLIIRAKDRNAAKNRQPVAASPAKLEECPKKSQTCCPACRKQFPTALIPHHTSGANRPCEGSNKLGVEPSRTPDLASPPNHPSKPVPPPSMATTLAKWNIELEAVFERPEGQRMHRLVVNLDTGSWQATGVLGQMGYHVGKNGVDQRTRRAILTEAVAVQLIAASPDYAEYVGEWGPPHSRKRIVKIRNSITAFARIRGRTKADYAGAIADWKSDLAWLKAEFDF
jgi:hypothetical protein